MQAYTPPEKLVAGVPCFDATLYCPVSVLDSGDGGRALERGRAESFDSPEAVLAFSTPL